MTDYFFLFRLKGLTRLEECDSCNQDDSGEERFQEHAAGHFGDCLVQSEQKSEEKATLTKLPHVSRPAPDEKGETKNLCRSIFAWKMTSYTRRVFYSS